MSGILRHRCDVVGRTSRSGAAVADAVRDPDRLEAAPGDEEPWQRVETTVDAHDTVEVTDFVLRALACPAIDARKERRPGNAKQVAELAPRSVDEFRVGSVEAAGVAAATEESAQQDVTLGRATGPLRRDPRSRKERQAFSAWHDEAGSAERMRDLIASIAERNGCR